MQGVCSGEIPNIEDEAFKTGQLGISRNQTAELSGTKRYKFRRQQDFIGLETENDKI